MTFVVLALFGSTLVGIVRVVIALVGIAPVGIGIVGITLVGIGTCTHCSHSSYNAHLSLKNPVKWHPITCRSD